MAIVSSCNDVINDCIDLYMREKQHYVIIITSIILRFFGSSVCTQQWA